jgi:hypothetical protein
MMIAAVYVKSDRTPDTPAPSKQLFSSVEAAQQVCR